MEGADSGLDEQAYFTLRSELARRGSAPLRRAHIIPGNHDRRAPLLSAFPGARPLEQMGSQNYLSPRLHPLAMTSVDSWDWTLVARLTAHRRILDLRDYVLRSCGK